MAYYEAFAVFCFNLAQHLHNLIVSTGNSEWLNLLYFDPEE